MKSTIIIFMEKAFAALTSAMSAHLGDRSKYVGASDVANCPRKAVLNKLNPPPPRPIHEQMIMALGHAIEDLMARLFESGGIKFVREKKMVHPTMPFFLAHLDFYNRNEKTNKAVVKELKSTKMIPTDPYASWTVQNKIQQGLVMLNHPSVSVFGSIIAVDRTIGHVKQFDVETPTLGEIVVFEEKAQVIWDAVNGGPMPKPEPSQLCGFCPFQDDCPAHQDCKAPLPQDVSDAAMQYLAAKAMEKEAEKLLAEARMTLDEYAGTRGFKGATPDGIKVSYTIGNGRGSIDSELLKGKYPLVYEEVYKASEKPAATLRVTAPKAK